MISLIHINDNWKYNEPSCVMPIPLISMSVFNIILYDNEEPQTYSISNAKNIQNPTYWTHKKCYA